MYVVMGSYFMGISAIKEVETYFIAHSGNCMLSSNDFFW